MASVARQGKPSYGCGIFDDEIVTLIKGLFAYLGLRYDRLTITPTVVELSPLNDLRTKASAIKSTKQ